MSMSVHLYTNSQVVAEGGGIGDANRARREGDRGAV
jgi:hypothetical protein